MSCKDEKLEKLEKKSEELKCKSGMLKARDFLHENKIKVFGSQIVCNN